jgi:general stress protein CsbA
LKELKDKYNLFFLGYYLLSLIPTIFTYPWENPNMLRTFTVIPSLIFFVGKSIVFLLKRFKYNKYVTIFLTILIIGSAAYELRTYFVFQAAVFKDVFINSMDFEYYRNLYK